MPPYVVEVVTQPGVVSPASNEDLAALAGRALYQAGAPSPASLSIILSDDAELARLNEEHMGHAGPTDVLSFPLLSPSAFPEHFGQDPAVRTTNADFALPPGSAPHLGDIILSVERAFAQAPDAPLDELRQLVVHGVLHVCGWDHAIEQERDAMRALEHQVLTANATD